MLRGPSETDVRIKSRNVVARPLGNLQGTSAVNPRSSRKAATRSRTSSRTGFKVCPRRGYVTSSAFGQPRHGRPQELDPGERIGLAREEQDRAADRRPVGDPGVGPLRRTGGMERVAEQDERRIRAVRLGGGQARHATAVRVAADRDIAARSARRGGTPGPRPRPCAWAGRSPRRARRARPDRPRTASCSPTSRSPRARGTGAVPCREGSLYMGRSDGRRVGLTGHGRGLDAPGILTTNERMRHPWPWSPSSDRTRAPSPVVALTLAIALAWTPLGTRAAEFVPIVDPTPTPTPTPIADPTPTSDSDARVRRPRRARRRRQRRSRRPSRRRRPRPRRPARRRWPPASRSTAVATGTASACRSTGPAVARWPARTPPAILAHYYQGTTLGSISATRRSGSWSCRIGARRRPSRSSSTAG